MSNEPRRILYVDDNPYDRELVRDALEHAPKPYELHEATSQPEFEAAFRGGRFDLVLTDFDICGFEGLEVLKAVRTRDPGVPVILVTGTGSEEVAVRAMKGGAADYIIKDRQALARLPYAIENALEAGRLEREARGSTAALRESEARLRRAATRAPVPVMIHAEDGEVILVSDTWVETTGYARADLSTVEEWTRRAHGAGAADILDRISAVYERTQPADEGEFEVVCADGASRTWWFSSTPVGVLPDGRRLAMTVATDVTERRSLEVQLRQSDKLQAVGRLAAGVAHDFNNMLQVILGYAIVATEELDAGTEPPRWLAMIIEAANRSANLTRRLLAFAREQPADPQPVDLREALPGMIRLLERIVEEETAITCAPAEDTWPVQIDPGQLDSIVANLVINARDAIADAGRIEVSTRNEVLADAPTPDLPSGEYVRLEVRDTGKGMTADSLERVFEPFYTTKQPGIGTGLGLASVYGIVKQNGGSITVESTPGAGTTFTVRLPRYLPDERAPEQEPRSATRAADRATVLVVEDDEAVRDITTRLLASIGYRTVATGEPRHAVELVREGLDDLSLVLTDVVMPDMSGIELARRVHAIDSALPVLFTSGYPTETLSEHGLDQTTIHFLPKPFSKHQLARTIDAVLRPSLVEHEETQPEDNDE